MRKVILLGFVLGCFSCQNQTTTDAKNDVSRTEPAADAEIPKPTVYPTLYQVDAAIWFTTSKIGSARNAAIRLLEEANDQLPSTIAAAIENADETQRRVSEFRPILRGPADFKRLKNSGPAVSAKRDGDKLIVTKGESTLFEMPLTGSCGETPHVAEKYPRKKSNAPMWWIPKSKTPMAFRFDFHHASLWFYDAQNDCVAVQSLVAPTAVNPGFGGMDEGEGFPEAFRKLTINDRVLLWRLADGPLSDKKILKAEKKEFSVGSTKFTASFDHSGWSVKSGDVEVLRVAPITKRDDYQLCHNLELHAVDEDGTATVFLSGRYGGYGEECEPEDKDDNHYLFARAAIRDGRIVHREVVNAYESAFTYFSHEETKYEYVTNVGGLGIQMKSRSRSDSSDDVDSDCMTSEDDAEGIWTIKATDLSFQFKPRFRVAKSEGCK